MTLKNKEVIFIKSKASQAGGLEKHAARILNAFIEKGAKVSLLTTSSKKSQHTNPFSTFSIQTAPWPPFLRMEQFDQFVKQFLQNHSADIIFGMDRSRHQTHIRAGNGIHAAYLESRRYAEGFFKYALCKINPLHRKILELEKAALENPKLKKLFTNSYMVRDQALKYYQIEKEKIQVIHNGVEWHEMQKPFEMWQEGREKALFEYGLLKNRFYFLFIGNGYLRKGLLPLLFAIKKLENPNVHLLVVGKDNQIDFYKKQAKELNIASQVSFFGPQRDIFPFYQLADALVIPSFYDPFANVTIEALAMGLFVVSSKQNGGHEILQKENGTVIENLLEEKSILSSLKKALEHPKTEKSSLAIRKSVESFDFSQKLQTLVESCG